MQIIFLIDFDKTNYKNVSDTNITRMINLRSISRVKLSDVVVPLVSSKYIICTTQNISMVM